MPQKHENITLSFPKELVDLLHVKVSRRGISRFVTGAVRKALNDKEEMLKLEAAYEEANHDPDRIETINEWKILDNDDETRDWEW